MCGVDLVGPEGGGAGECQGSVGMFLELVVGWGSVDHHPQGSSSSC